MTTTLPVNAYTGTHPVQTDRREPSRGLNVLTDTGIQAGVRSATGSITDDDAVSVVGKTTAEGATTEAASSPASNRQSQTEVSPKRLTINMYGPTDGVEVIPNVLGGTLDLRG